MKAASATHRLIPLLVLSMLLLIGGCSSAPSAAAATVSEASSAARPGGELLIAQPPAGWQQIGATSLANIKRAEFIPNEEEAANWTRRITFESLAEKPLPDPIEFAQLLNEDRDRACNVFESYVTFSGEENGYPTAVNLLVCHEDKATERSEVSMIKTIQGNDFFYVVTRARRGPPIEAEAPAADRAPAAENRDAIEEAVIGAWSLYLKSVGVCDTERTSHPCPEAPETPD